MGTRRGLSAASEHVLGRGRRHGAGRRLRPVDHRLRGAGRYRPLDSARRRRPEGNVSEMIDALTFVLCIENNAIRAQALLLCESIRQFGGRHCCAPILAVAPRPGLGIDREARRQLDGMGVEYVEEPLNRICPEYGSANRVFTAAWAEGRTRSEWIV